MLDRLQALDLIAWRPSGARIHVVAAKNAEEFLPPPAKLLSRWRAAITEAAPAGAESESTQTGTLRNVNRHPARARAELREIREAA
jgi:hypothetical protein